MNEIGHFARVCLLAVALVLATAASAAADHGAPPSGRSYTFLQPGFTQEVMGVSPQPVNWGQPAFAADGDILVSECTTNGGALYRFDMQSTPPSVHSTAMHSLSSRPSQTSCGLVNHPNGHMYTAGYAGIFQIDETSDSFVSSDAGRGSGITVDPQTQNLVYVGQSGNTIRSYNLTTGTATQFLAWPLGGGVDRFGGLVFDPGGSYLFVSDVETSPGPPALDVFRRNGSLVRTVPISSGARPSGAVFVDGPTKFVVTGNRDGTMSRFDFPGNNFELPPVQTTLASGGFHASLMSKGRDGCLYEALTGNRYDDGTVVGAHSQPDPDPSLPPLPLSDERSVVQIGPPGAVCDHLKRKPATLSLSPKTATNEVDSQHCVVATVRDGAGNPPSPSVTVRFNVQGAVNTSGAAATNASGQATFCYTGPGLPGSDTITAYADTDGDSTRDADEPADSAVKQWVVPGAGRGCKVTGGGRITAANGDRATFEGNAQPGTPPKGDEQYQDLGPTTSLTFRSLRIDSIVCSADRTRASIFGTARVNGQSSFDFRIDARDAGEPGRNDTYRIRVSNGYDSGERKLDGGNIQIHR